MFHSIWEYQFSPAPIYHYSPQGGDQFSPQTGYQTGYSSALIFPIFSPQFRASLPLINLDFEGASQLCVNLGDETEATLDENEEESTISRPSRRGGRAMRGGRDRERRGGRTSRAAAADSDDATRPIFRGRDGGP